MRVNNSYFEQKSNCCSIPNNLQALIYLDSLKASANTDFTKYP